MKAIQIHRTGGPEVLQVVELADPRPGPGEVVVRAEVIGVGKPDVMIRTGVYPWMPPLPAIPGNEMVGVIESVGNDVDLALGQRVFVSSRELAQRGGCYADRICTPARAVYPIPPAIGPLAAVHLGNFQLAMGMMFDSGSVPPRSILVQGAAGGVGTALVQTAAAHGIEVIAVASTDARCDYAKAAGAHHVHRRGSGDLRKAVLDITRGRGVDLVLDHIGGPGFVAQLDLLAARGTLLSYNVLHGLPSENMIGELRKRLDRSVAVRCYSVHVLDRDPIARRDLMLRAIDLLAQRRVCPPTPALFELAQAGRAHQLLDSVELVGKVALTC